MRASEARADRHARLNVEEGRPWYAARCHTCDGRLSDRDARHGYTTCDRCAPDWTPPSGEED